MDIKELQQRIGTTADGMFGPKSRAALLAAFTNKQAPAITASEEQALADRLGCSLKQLRAVALVESSGGGFDHNGRPKILYERHKFHELTGGRWSTTSYSNARYGGYSEGSWDKLMMACAKDPEAAFGSCSWGKFQVMGYYATDYGFASSFDMAISTVASEAAHYDLLANYVEANHMQDEMRALSADPEDCRAFARAYNGSAYARNGYHTKLAEAMR